MVSRLKSPVINASFILLSKARLSSIEFNIDELLHCCDMKI